MSGSRDIDVDDLFERSADARLLDRRRRDELGLPPSAKPASASPARFGPESMLGGDGVPLAEPRGAMLRVSLRARPDRELIPGAVVTVVAEVADDGDTDADDVRLRVALPPEAEPIPGSFARDDVPVDGEALLGEGLRVGSVPAAGAIRLRFSVRILPGTGALDLGVHASAPGVPVIAAPTLRLTRRTGHAAYNAPRPFFELEAGETDDDLATVAAAPPEPKRTVDTTIDEPIAPLVIRSEEPPTAVPAAPQLEAEPRTEAQSEPESIAASTAPSAAEALTEPPPRPEVDLSGTARTDASQTESAGADDAPVPEPPAWRKRAVDAPPVPEVYVLARSIDADEVRALERVFSGAVPHGLAALALLSSVAAADGPLGRALGVSAFARTVSAALPRALVAARMSRPTPPVVTSDALAGIDPTAAIPDARPDLDHDRADDAVDTRTTDTATARAPLLVARLDARELEALRALLARALDDPFLRGVQVLLAVAPRALHGAADADAATRARDALAAYRGAAGGWLMRVTVRRAVDRRYDPLTADDALLHDAGRALVAALREAVA